MTALYIIVGALVGCAIDMTFVHPQPVYSIDWTAPVLGAVGGLVARALFAR
jgi:hypothetical protein